MSTAGPENGVAKEGAPLERFRSNFRSSVRWLNTPAAPLAARPVADTMRSALSQWESGEFSWEEWEQAGRGARARYGSLVGLPENCVALVDSVAAATAIIARSAAVRRVVASSAEFVSCLQPWLATGRQDVTVDLLPAEDGWSSTERYLDAIRSDCLVTVSEVTSLAGNRADLVAIAQRCREVGARLFVNLTQSLGALWFRAAQVDADYIACHGYKWLLAPRGCAWLAVKERYLPELEPTVPGWHAVAASDKGYFGTRSELIATAARLDGTFPWMSWLGAPPALDVISIVPPPLMEEYVLSLAQQARDELSASGFHPIPVEHASQIVCLRANSVERCLAALRQAGVVAGSAAKGQVRIGIHGFNTSEDISAFAKVVHESCRGVIV